MNGRKTGRKLISLILSLVMMVTMVPMTVAAAPATDSDNTASNVEIVKSYAEQLRTENQKSDYSAGGFTWDTEGKKDSWRYFNGVMMDAFLMEGDTAYADAFYDGNISDDGTIKNYIEGELDSVPTARGLFDLLSVSDHADKYKKAIQYVYTQLENQRTYENCGGNYLHKQNDDGTPQDSWSTWSIGLDGLYMAEPFLMECANAIDANVLSLKDKEGNPVSSEDIYKEVYDRFAWVAETMCDETTGLYHHGWNPSANTGNGHFWGRGIGWYAVALVDVIEMMPADYQAQMKPYLTKLFDGMLQYQDEESGMWYNVVNNPGLSGNKLETSVSAMMAYALMKAYNNGYVSEAKYGEAGLKAFNGVVDNKVTESEGSYTVADIYQKSGVGETDAYYTTNAYMADEAKGTGALIMAATVANTTAEKLSTDDTEEPTEPSTPDNSGTEDNTQTADWKDIPGGTYYERTQSMTTDGEYVILYQNNGTSTSGKALHYYTYYSYTDVNGQDINISSQNGQYTITNIDEAATWHIDSNNKIYCTVNGQNYYLYRNSNSASLTTSSSSATRWSINVQNSAVQFTNSDYSLRWRNNDFQIRNDGRGTGTLYLYEKHSSPGGQAALTGTLSYTVKTGSSLTEDQIKEAASVLYRTDAGSEETTLDWNEVTVSWDNSLNTNTVGTYNMTVSYQDIALGSITVNVQETVLDKTQPNWGLNPAQEPYPEYPADGAVRIDKTATEQNFNSTGVVKVELDTAGISVKQGVDVVLVVDVSNSMGWTDDWYLTNPDATTDNLKIPVRQSGTAETTTDKLDQAMASAQEFANILLGGNSDGSKSNNSISFVTFAGYDDDNSNETQSSGRRDFIDSVQTVFTNVQDAATANEVFADTKFTYYTVDGTSVDYNLQIGSTSGRVSSGINRGNTNYDYAFAEANAAVTQLKNSYGGASAYEDTGRETIVVFMTDGAPSHYNGNRLNGGHADTLYGTNETYAAVGAYNGNGPDNADTWLQFISNPNTNAETLDSNIDSFYAVGFDLNHGGFGSYSWSQGDLQPVLEGLAGENSVDVELVENGSALQEFYRSLANQIMFAGTNAVVTDTINSNFTLQTTQTTGTGGADAKHGTLTTAPTIEVTSYELYTKATAPDDTLIGTRTGDSSILEKVTFSEDGTAAYSDQLGSDSIMTTDSDGNVTIEAKYFTYTKKISEDGSAVEKFVWNIGDITDDEVVLSYYAYLTGSMEGTREKGDVYYTNEGATLEYVDINGNYAKKDYPMPAVAWGGASTSFEYYLVNEKGLPVNRAGQVIPFANRIVIYGDTVGLNLNQDATIPAQRIEADDYLPEGYFLYDVEAYYTVSTASSAELERGITVSKPSDDAYKTTGGVTQTGAQTTIVISPAEPVAPDETYIQTRVAFGVRWDLTPTFTEYELVKDQIVIDYGKAIQADVIANDSTIPDGYTGSLIGFTAYNANANLKQMQQSAGSAEYTTNNGTYTIDGGKVNFQLSRMLSQVEKVFCVVKITEDADSNNYYYLYEELDIIPATNVYYETDFAEGVFTFETTGTAWDEVTVDGDIVADGPQDDGTIGQNLYGYDSSYANDKYQSDASSWFVTGADAYDPTKTTSEFAFRGTGFDIISRTDTKEGFIRVTVYSDFAKTDVEKRVTVLNKSESELRLYQIPVVSIEDLTYGTHYVEIEVYGARESEEYPALSSGGQFHFDAVRIYNPVNASANASATSDAGIAYAAYVADGEADASIQEVRNMLIAANTFDVTEDPSDSEDPEYVPGVSFIDRTQQGAELADYKTIGPNNEVYLTGDQYIGFKVQVENGALPASIDIGAKSADGNPVTLHTTILDADFNPIDNTETTVDIESSTAQFYDLMGESSVAEAFGGNDYIYVLIDNYGDGVLSITDLKIASGSTAASAQVISDRDTVEKATAYVNSIIAKEAESVNYDILSADFTVDSIKRNKTATMMVTTSEAVESLQVQNVAGRAVDADITVEDTGNGTKTWTVAFKVTSVGNLTFTVTGYGADGTAGTPAEAGIKVTVR